MIERLGRAVQALALQRVQRRDEGRVLFNSFNGQFSDSPRAIHEAMERLGSPQSAAWVGGPTDASFPPRLSTVGLQSRGYFRELGKAGFVVANLQMPNNFHKRPGTVYLQTWHGTPLKRIGLDNRRWDADRTGKRQLVRELGRWDYLVSQNRFSSEIFRRAFRFDGEMLETGYPRNDILQSPERAHIRASVRAQLGVSEGQIAILYAPTWRDNLVTSSGRPGFSLALDSRQIGERLGDQYRVMLRLHRDISDNLGSLELPLQNVSRYPDVRDLYLAADALVTDYSSAMFDFAVTGKPMLFYTYDLAEYRDQTRGFYFELEDEAPGPLCSTTTELIDCLLDLERIDAEHAVRYKRFRERYCHLDDGRASERVVERVFA